MSSKKTHVHNSDNTIEHDHHEEFRQWVKCLSINELERALTFWFVDDNDVSDGRVVHAKEADPCFWMDDTNGSSGMNSHEYELLLEMINSQAPKPIPIHPR